MSNDFILCDAYYTSVQKPDEGVSFPSEEKGITYLYRLPNYLEPPETTTNTYGNTTLASPSSGGYIPTIFSGVESFKMQCNQPTAPATGPTRVYSGLNTINFVIDAEVNQWTHLILHYGFNTTSIGTNDFKIKFGDGSKYFVKDAIDNGYLSPLCLFIGGYASWIDPVWTTLYTEGYLSVRDYPINNIVCKPILHAITGVEFTSTKFADWGGYHGTLADGFYAYTYDKTVKFSKSPFTKQLFLCDVYKKVNNQLVLIDPNFVIKLSG